MFKKVLLPTDGSPISRKAVRQGVAFAKSIGAKVVGFFSAEEYRTGMYAVYVASAYPLSRTEFETATTEAAQKQLAVVERAAAQAGVPYEGVYKMNSEPWQAIIEAAKEKKCDLIFMGSHGRGGLLGVVLGSQTTKVLTHSKIPVLVTR